MIAVALLMSSPAHACGGFFCNNVEPVVQSAERILFMEEPGEGWTTLVEVQFQGPPTDFAWVVPVPVMLDADADIGVAPAGLFDDLEAVTGPTFVNASTADALYAEPAAGCSCGSNPFWADWFAAPPDMSGVDVVGEAVVGPYDIEVITAEEADNLVTWLQNEGYQIPFSATSLIEDYVAEDYAFIGLKLLPDTPAGPIDTLVLRCGAQQPVVPLRLTQVAAVPDMEIVTYVLADERYVPGNYVDLPFDYSRIEQVQGAVDDYEWFLMEDIDAAGGQAFHTEFAGPVSQIVWELSDDTVSTLGSGTYLTRFRSFMDAEDMTVDPMWVPDPEAPDVSNVHVVGDDTQRAGVPLGALGIVWVAVVAWRRRRRS